MWSSSSFVGSSNEAADSSPIHNIAQYIEDYIDLVENVPNEIIRQITQIHEYNHRYNQLLTTLESMLEIIASDDSSSKNENRRKKSLMTLHKCLIEIQEISDEKLFIVQNVLDHLDTKARQLDLDYRNVNTANSASGIVVTPPKSNVVQASSSNNHSLSTADSINLTCNETLQVNEFGGSKELSGGATIASSPPNVNSSSVNSKRSSSRRNLGSGRGNDVGNNGDVSITTSKRGVKRGSKGHSKEVKRNKNKDIAGNSPPAIYEETPIDPDEPTYCLCEQVSFGEMIGCDNDACPIEWFHFSCVALTTKPKGKWYCPNCRGDRSNIPKK